MKKNILYKGILVSLMGTAYGADHWQDKQFESNKNPFASCKNTRNLSSNSMPVPEQSREGQHVPSKPKRIIDLSKYPLITNSDCGPVSDERNRLEQSHLPDKTSSSSSISSEASSQSIQQLPLLPQYPQEQEYIYPISENETEIRVVVINSCLQQVGFRLRDGNIIVAPGGYWRETYKVFEKNPYITSTPIPAVDTSKSNMINNLQSNDSNGLFQFFSLDNQFFILKRVSESLSSETIRSGYTPPPTHQQSYVSPQQSPWRVPRIFAPRIVYQRDASKQP